MTDTEKCLYWATESWLEKDVRGETGLPADMCAAMWREIDRVRTSFRSPLRFPPPTDRLSPISTVPSGKLPPMLSFKARVQNGRIVIDQPTDLPECTPLQVVVVIDEDDPDDDRPVSFTSPVAAAIGGPPSSTPRQGRLASRRT